MADANKLKSIVERTIEVIDASKDQVFEIIENTRTEYEQLKKDYHVLKNTINQVIQEVDQLERKDKIMRSKLAEVSKQFTRYDENEIKDVYHKASEVRIEYFTKQNEEKHLREKRTQMEISLRKFSDTLEDAEKIINQVSVAMGYLKGEIMAAVGDMSAPERMAIGIGILEAQERERKRISRDIHDGPAQAMANVIMQADIVEHMLKKDVEEGIKELRALKEHVRLALTEVRGIIFDLRPMSLDDLGLDATLERLVEKHLQDCGYTIKLTIKDAHNKVDSMIATALYRLVQEMLNNIKKHAKAKNVTIKLEYGSKFLALVVSDDGQGFDVQETMDMVHLSGESFGLVGMQERVNQLSGTLTIQSRLKLGTVITVKLPISREVIEDERAH